jgi:hypothetical protein
MRTQSVTQRFEFIRYSLGTITFLGMFFRAVREVPEYISSTLSLRQE